MNNDHVTLTLPFGTGQLTLRVPRRNLLAVVTPPDVLPAPDPAAEVLRAVREPVGAPPLAELVRPGQKVLVLIDDKTRLTPQHVVLPPLLSEIERAARDVQIRILIATGTHSPMTPDEIRARVGAALAARYPIVNHDWKDPAGLVDLGRTPYGTPIHVNRLLVESDLVLAVGGTVPHCLAGWAGGAKIVQPGVCGNETTSATHDLETVSPLSHLGRLDNPMRMEIEQIVKRVPLHLMVNVVFDRHGRLVHVVAGEPIASHHRSVDLARPIWVVPVPGLADIVVVSPHPADIDYWQAAKGLVAAGTVVKRGGDILMAAPMFEGYSSEPEHVETQRLLAGVPSREIMREVRRLGITDGGGSNTAALVSKINELAWVSIYSPGLSDSDYAMLRHARVSSLDEGLEVAFERQGPEARVTVITHGGDTCPVLKGAG